PIAMPPKQSDRPPRKAWQALLRRADQAAVATLIAVGLLSLGGYWFWHLATNAPLIEIDRSAPRHAAFLVDINRADWPELAQLPGIGETLARRIVESRQADGEFRDLNDLRRVRGIGPRTFEQLRPHLLPLADGQSVAGREP